MLSIPFDKNTEIAEVTRLVELEAQREALLGSKTAASVKAGASAVQNAD